MLLSILLSFFALTAEAGRSKDFQCGDVRDCVIPYDAEGNQNGTETCFEDETKKVKTREITWKNGKREGIARCFKKNKVTEEAHYKNDVLNGPFVEFDDDSNGDRVTLMENGEEVGLSFSVKDGKVSSVHYCMIGETPEFGAILSCGDKNYGKFNPLLATWRKEELARNKLAAAKDARRMNGPQESRYSSGKLRSKWTHVNGEIHGKFLSYTEEGKVKLDCDYKNGQVEGQCTEYDDAGRMDKRETWANRKLVKEETFFDNGKPERISVSEGDKKFCHTDFYENGQKMSQWCALERYSWSWYGSRDGAYTEWDPTGDLSVRGTYANGLRSGTWEYYSDKQVGSELFYEKGNLVKAIEYVRTPPQHRIVREYFPDGSLKNETQLQGLEGNQKHMI